MQTQERKSWAKVVGGNARSEQEKEKEVCCVGRVGREREREREREGGRESRVGQVLLSRRKEEEGWL